MTDYIVLRQVAHENGHAWTVADQVSAPSGPAAVRKYTGDGADVIEGTWRAVPLASWRGGITTKRVTTAARELIE